MSFVFDIEKVTLENTEYRKILYTGMMQLVLMSIPVGGEIELEVHPNNDQFLRIEAGLGEVRFNEKSLKIQNGSAIIIKKNTYHHIINTGNTPLKLYTLYSPPVHEEVKDEEIKVDQEVATITPITPITSITGFTTITGHKDTDLRLLLELSDREFFIFCGKKDSLQFKNKYVNKLCKDENLWRERLFKYYGKFYPEPEQTWKNLYLSLVYRLAKYKYEKDNISFTNASDRGHLDVVKYLMSFPKIIDPSAGDNYAIRWASESGHLSVVKYLIGLPKEYWINPAARDNYAIIRARQNGHLNVVNYLSSLPKEYGVHL